MIHCTNGVNIPHEQYYSLMLFDFKSIQRFFSDKNATARKILSIAAVSLFSLLTGCLIPIWLKTDTYVPLVIEFIFGILLIAVFVFILAYHKEVNTDMVALIEDKQIKDITIKNRVKSVQITQSSLETHQCKVEMEMEIENYMPERYEKYTFGIESDTYVPNITDITGYDGKRKIILSETNADHFYVHKLFSDGKEGKTKSVECRFDVPLNLDSGQSKTVLISYPTSGFEKLFNNCQDYTSIRVIQKTEKLTFNVTIDKVLGKNYVLSIDDTYYKKGDYTSFVILDSSKNRMLNYEKLLSSKRRIPRCDEQSIRWDVPNPMIGYTYRLYFKLNKKEKKTRASQRGR